MRNTKKPLIIAILCIVAAALVTAGVWFFWLKDYMAAINAPAVPVNTVATIIGLNADTTPRYSGVVEPQDAFEVNRDENKPLGEVLVKPGDKVLPGDVLFRYDTGDLEMSVREAEIAVESIANQINTLNNQLATLKAEKSKAGQDEQATYTIEIQKVEIQIQIQENDSKKKQEELEKLKLSLEDTDVLCTVEGVVKEVNVNPTMDASGKPAPFISILSSGDYRIKGTVSELNLGSLFEGMAVIVSSRIDPSATWKGFIETIEREPSSDQNNNMYYYGFDSGEQSSKYHFYVSVDSQEGLILGQHIYIQPDTGVSEAKPGLWLPSVYVDHDATGSFVWARNERDRLEKRMITLGEYDSDNSCYEIKSGLSKIDCIAYPSDSLRPGMPTVKSNSYQSVPSVGGDVDHGFGGSAGQDGSYGGGISPDDGFVVPDGAIAVDPAPAYGEG